MRLEQALEEYEKRRRKSSKELEKIRKKYNKRLEKRIKELLKKIGELERKKIPKNVDDNIVKIVTAERRNYVTSLRNALGGITDMEGLGKRLPDLAKLHVGHGRYLLLIFEKDVYAINRLLKELSEDYTAYYRELADRGLEELSVERILGEMEETEKAIKASETEIKELRKRLEELEREREELYRESGLDGMEEEIKALRSRIRRTEMEVRSKASKLQRPVKRMRLGESMAEELIRDTSIALRNPGEFLEFVRKIEPRLEPKQRKAARWFVDNLVKKVEELDRERRKLKVLEDRRDEILRRGASVEDEMRRLESAVSEKEAELRKLQNRLEHLRKSLDEEIRKLEEVLGESIER